MSAYKYLGLTSYIVVDDFTNESLAILAEAIHTLNTSGISPSTEGYEFVTQTDAFKNLYNHTTAVTPNKQSLPQNTPAAYHKAQFEYMMIKGHMFVRLYIPAVSEDETALYQYIISDLMPVLDMLFGDNLISAKTRACGEHVDFADAMEESLIAVPTPPKPTKDAKDMPQAA